MKRAILFFASLPLMVTSLAPLGAKPATAMPIGNECPEGNSREFVHAETRDFDIYICGRNFPKVYVGVAKNGDGDITLPLVETSRRNTFVALNHNYPDTYRYVLTPDHLTVTKNGRTIVNQGARWVRY
ncbi:MAG: hypothetical protein DSM106950_16970 [Stigonema ocellatum SAG 48.90 = DSM 106950]|nr:hypothetical protein [Stigonema ocellatum SAG 48.90 = DSM 106950]